MIKFKVIRDTESNQKEEEPVPIGKHIRIHEKSVCMKNCLTHTICSSKKI